MDLALKIRRYDPESDKSDSYWQDYKVEVDDSFTVLDALIKVREEIDGTLSLRCSCRSAICGSCSMRVNGHASLACKAKVIDSVKGSEPLIVEPMGNMPVIKDLVVEMKPFWQKIESVDPWLKPSGPEPEGEYIAPNEDMVHLAGVMNCIMCGACVSDCTALEGDSNFLGPAALAKAYRFVEDPRDGATNERLEELSQSSYFSNSSDPENFSGIWDCTRCFECVERCPKDVDPMHRIMALRGRAMDAGYDNTVGARHTKVFEESVSHSGRLNELMLPIKTFGMFNILAMLNMAPVGLRALLHGKMPSLIHKPIPNAKKVRKLASMVKKIKLRGGGE